MFDAKINNFTTMHQSQCKHKWLKKLINWDNDKRRGKSNKNYHNAWQRIYLKKNFIHKFWNNKFITQVDLCHNLLAKEIFNIVEERFSISLLNITDNFSHFTSPLSKTKTCLCGFFTCTLLSMNEMCLFCFCLLSLQNLTALRKIAGLCLIIVVFKIKS